MTMLSHRDIVVVGSGFSGLGMAMRLKQEGLDDFVVLEQGDAVGGTWRDNHYPGCACDVPAPLYSLSFAPNPNWSRLFAGYAEIRAYMEDCADRFGVRPHLRFGAEVTGATWDEEAHRWTIEIGGEPAMTARVVIGGLGGLSRPAFPDIEGLGDFQGDVFHSAQWRHDVDLTGKRVAVVGTGASAIQFVPRIAKVAGHVDVHQRTAPWILPKLDRPTARLERAVWKRFPITLKLLRGFIFTTTESIGYPITRRPALLAGLEAIGRLHLRRAVKDPELRAKLAPGYRVGCKRILISNDYLPALTRENVDVVTDGIARITPTGVVTRAGEERPADVLICGTGFNIEDAFQHVEIRGRGGRSLIDTWNAEGIQAHRGTTITGFPNLMLLSGPNTGTGSTSQVYMIEAQIRYVLDALRQMREQRLDAVDVKPEVQAASNADIQARMDRTVWLSGGCSSWYLSADGVNRTLYPGLSSRFAREMRTFAMDEYLGTRAGDPREIPETVPASA